MRKAGNEEANEKKHPDSIHNEELKTIVEKDNEAIVIDVREQAEFAFHHIPNAKSIPLGELDDHLKTLKKESSYYLVCRTGSRSDLAAQKMVKAGFNNVKNVLPGMSEWKT